MTDQKKIDAELHYSSRFDRRMQASLYTLLLVFPFLAIGHAIVDSQVEIFVPHILTWIMALIIVLSCRDGITMIIFSSVFWSFLFMLYMYQSLHWQNVNYGLFDPERAAKITLASQFGLFLAYLLSPRAPLFTTALYQKRYDNYQALSSLEPVLLVIGVFAIVCSAFRLLPIVITSTLVFFFYVFIGVRANRLKEKLGTDWLFWSSVMILFITAMANTNRTTLLGFLFSVLFLIVILRRKILSFPLLFSGLVVFSLLSLFSDAVVIARAAEYQGVSGLSAAWQHFSNPASLLETLNPFAGGDTGQVLTLEFVKLRSQFFSNVYGAEGMGLMGRITPLPQMDIVTSRLPEQPAYLDWDRLFRIAGSALPSFGQQKELIYSDHVVWDLGLRSRYDLGRPMITAQGELFSLGGYLFVVIVPALCMWSLNLMYRMIARLTMSRIVAIMVLSQFFIGSIVGSTILSMIAVATRGPLIFLMVMGTLIWLTKLSNQGNRRERHAQSQT